MSARLYNLLYATDHCNNEIKNKVLPSDVKFLLPQGGTQGIPLILFNEAIWGKHWEGDFGLLGLGSNCLVLISHRQLGNCLLSTVESYGLTAQYLQNFIWVNVWFLPTNWLHTKAHGKVLNWILVLLCGSDIFWKIKCISWVWTLVQSPACRIDTMEMPVNKATDAATPWRVPRHICALAILKTFLTKEEMVLYWCVLPIITNKQRGQLKSIQVFPKGLRML